MASQVAQAREVISFGPFRLVASERLLTQEGAPVELGGRSLDILLALVSQASAIVGKKELLARVWPDVTVGEDSLRFHIAALRKALGDGRDGARYIETLAGRGYCFVAPIVRTRERAEEPAAGAGLPCANLPACPIGMVGRNDDVHTLSSQLKAARLVTIVGAGGVGKTTVAVAVGHRLIEDFAGAVLFVDLGVLRSPDLVATALASMLGLSVQSDDATPILTEYLRDKRILLIVDTCEHLIEAVAALASRIFTAAPHVHMLATSREALQTEGERVYRLDPLACPPNESGITAAIAQRFPATQLFMERATATGARVDFGDPEAAVVVAICRRLDGVALAIELAARRVEAYGLHQTAALLDQHLILLWLGPRTAPPRQKTLQATLDWSYRLLSEVERVVLRRLAIFVGHFTLDAALAVATSATVDQAAAFAAIDSLVAKSMVATHPIGAMMRYRLLDTTRAYVLEFSVADAEFAELAVRHATYYQRWLEQAAIEWSSLSNAAERAPYFAGLNNVRAALEWCFGARGNAEAGVGLAAAAVPLFWAMSLLAECHRWSERALLALDNSTRDGLQEMHLQAGLGTSLMNMHGEGEAARAALNRSLAIAEERGDMLAQMGLLGMLHMFHLRGGGFNSARHYAERSSAFARNIDDPAAIAFARSMLGRARLLTGDIGGARALLEDSLRQWSRPQRTSTIYLAADRHYRAGVALARTLWLQGHPAQAMERAHQAVKDVMDHPVALTGALAWVIGVFLWTGDLRSAEMYIQRFVADAESHSLGPNGAVGQGLKGQLAIRQGDAAGGVASLQACMETLQAARYGLLTTEFNISLAQGLATTGRFAEGMALVDNTIQLVESNGDLVYMPELLRVKGSLLSTPQRNRDDAERWLRRSLELSRHQGARAWELRTAVDLAALLARQRGRKSARALLRPVFEQFVEGFDTLDLKAAECLLAALGSGSHRGMTTPDNE